MNEIHCNLVFDANSDRRYRSLELRRVLEALEECDLTFEDVDFRPGGIHKGKWVKPRMVIAVSLEVSDGEEPADDNEAEEKINAELDKCRFEFGCRVVIDPNDTDFKSEEKPYHGPAPTISSQLRTGI